MVIPTKLSATIFLIGKVTWHAYSNAFLHIFPKSTNACIYLLTFASSQYDNFQ